MSVESRAGRCGTVRAVLIPDVGLDLRVSYYILQPGAHTLQPDQNKRRPYPLSASTAKLRRIPPFTRRGTYG